MRLSPFIYKIETPALTLRRFLKRLALWTAICVFAAGPSYYFGNLINTSLIWQLGMITGVLICIGVYTALACTAFTARLTAQPFMRSSIGFIYGLRVLYSGFVFALIIYTETVPGPVYLESIELLATGDLWCGFWAAMFLEWLIGSNLFDEQVFFGSLLLTLTQAVIVSGLTAALLIPAYVGQRLVRKLPPPPPSSVEKCVVCGYDLRASTGVCPECGHVIAKTATASTIVL